MIVNIFLKKHFNKLFLFLAFYLVSFAYSKAQSESEIDSLESLFEQEVHANFGDAIDNKEHIKDLNKTLSYWTNLTTFTDSMALELEIANIYNSLYPRVDSIGLDYLPFKYAVIGYMRLRNDGMLENDKILTIIDYTKPSKVKRFYCIDMENLKFLFHTYVSHGKNTGGDVAIKFSNTPQSLQSSMGLYLTGETYRGSKGYSLRLDGVEKGINDNMRKRAVVMHSAPYVSKKFIEKYGRLGRSYGCPVVPVELHQDIIKTIKNKSAVFGYFNDELYLSSSNFIQMRSILKK